MPHKGAREECDTNLWDRIIAELPCAAVKRVHELRLAGEDADRHSTGDNLSVSSQIGADVEQSLASTRMNAEAGDHFVHDHGRAGLLRDLADFFQEFDGLKIWMAAL